jgi:hypothetical protein
LRAKYRSVGACPAGAAPIRRSDSESLEEEASPPQRYVWMEWAGSECGACRPEASSARVKLTGSSFVLIAIRVTELSGFWKAT